jgi:hypothetical protein
MSGQLVGEVIAASTQLRAGGLSRNGFLALIAIAEKCHHQTRQATVRRSWIQAAIYCGNSTRTAERAVRELTDNGLIHVVKRGYKAPNQKSLSTMYELGKLPPPIVADANGEAPASHGWRELAAAKSGEAAAKSDQAAATQGGGLDGSLDGSTDGGTRARARTDHQRNGSPPTTPPHTQTGLSATHANGNGAITCPKHPHGPDHSDPCGTCAAIRKRSENADERRWQNYRAAWTEYNELLALSPTGAFNGWRPVRPPRFPSDFDPDVPWRQPERNQP